MNTQITVCNERFCAFIMKQLFSVIEYCHTMNVVHRDLKLENLMIKGKDIENGIKVIDFGRSKILKPQSKIKELAGSLYYVAPEVISNQEYDAKCDMWSAGVILCILLTGKPPFLGKSKEETIKLIQKGEVNFDNKEWNNISATAKDLIRKILVVEPDKRLSPHRAVKSKWIIEKTSSSDQEKTNLNLPLINLKAFKVQSMLMKAVLSYITSQKIDNEEDEIIKKFFISIDKNNNGQISKDELIESYIEHGMSSETAMKEANDIISYVDLNQNGNIDYNGNILN